MVGNVKTVIGQPDAVPAHLIDQVLPDDHDLLTAVLDSKRTTRCGCCSFFLLLETERHLATDAECV